MDLSGPREPRSNENCKTAPSILKIQPQVSTRTMHHINCMYTNADTLRNKMTELECRLKSVEGTVDEIHVIAINEVNSKFNIHCIESCELQLNGYDMFSTNLSTSDGRGIILYAKHELGATPVIFKSQF